MRHSIRIAPLHRSCINVHHLEHRRVSWVAAPPSHQMTSATDQVVLSVIDVGRLLHDNELTCLDAEEQRRRLAVSWSWGSLPMVLRHDRLISTAVLTVGRLESEAVSLIVVWCSHPITWFR